MSYTLSYTGANIDSILSKADTFEDAGELWKVIPSSVTTLEIKNLMTPGNYIYSGSLKTPAMDPLFGFKLSGTQTAASKSCSCLIFVRHVNQNIYQYINLHGIIDSPDQTMCIVWIRNSDYTYTPKVFYLSEDGNSKLAIITNTSSDKGSNKFDKQIRVTTADKAIQYYDAASKSYKKFVLNMMQKSVYGSISDIFNTIDSTINYDFVSHGNDSGIHVTNDQIANYDAKQRSDTLETTMSDYKTSLMNTLNSNINSIKSKLSSASSTLSSVSSAMTTHKNNTTIHPSSSQISNWNSKANTGHTHNQDGRVTVSAKDVVGTLSIDNIPPIAQERFKVVASTTLMLSLTSSDVQLGDWVWVSDSAYPLLFVVTDTSKLGSMDGFTQLTPNKPDYTWGNVQNKPTTISDLEITDVYSNSQIETYINNLDTKLNQNHAKINSLNEVLNVCTDSNINNTSGLETSIDTIDQKLKLLMELVEMRKASQVSATTLNAVESIVS